MRSVRCDACGTKALLAASQCPKCGHLFEVRDGSGELLPLAHCQGCDSYYPAHVASCKWCGTALVAEKPRKRDTDRLRWIAAGTFAVAVVLGLLARDPSAKAGSRARSTAQPKPKSAAPADTFAAVVPTVPTVPADTAPRVAPSAPGYAADAGETVAAASPVVTDVSAPATPSPSSARSAAISQSGSAPSAAASGAASPRHSPPIATPRARRGSSPWVSMVATQWVIVRTDATRSAHIVASVGPNSRVQLGEARGSWRRIKSRGIAGWVDVSGGPFATVRTPPHRSRRIAGRE